MPAFNVYHINSATDAEILIALLSAAGFDSFEEKAEMLDAYRLANDHASAVNDLDRIANDFPLTYRWETLPEVNWNAQWEANFKPIRIADKLGIRAQFHPPFQGVKQELIIDPKMAFGTGHHATTYMVSEAMFDFDLKDNSILDYGCGTGVLAILAKRLGAGFVWAVDIERPSYENTLENAELNGVSLDVVTHGTLEDVKVDRRFDVILANINRNVILDSLPSLYERLTPGGRLFVSGILKQDETLVENAASTAGFSPLRKTQREDWMAWVFNRS